MKARTLAVQSKVRRSVLSRWLISDTISDRTRPRLKVEAPTYDFFEDLWQVVDWVDGLASYREYEEECDAREAYSFAPFAGEGVRELRAPDGTVVMSEVVA